MASELRGYQALISEATGETSPEALAEIEEHMRHTVFHSTLDWQSAAQLKKGAREAHQLYVAMLGDSATNQQLIRAYATSKRDREFIRTRSPEVVAEWCVNLRAQLKRAVEAA